MKPDYKNWVPKYMVNSLIAGTIVIAVLFVIFGVIGVGLSGALRWIIFAALLLALLIVGAFLKWSIMAYRDFSYNGTRQLSKQIVEGTANYIKLPDSGTGLDVGCGSGALTIACAKKNPNAKMIGVDRWGKEYSDFSNMLCCKNAEADGVKNIEFMKGDACKLDFKDESFDAVTSNYVYHNVTGVDKQKLLLETLRVLKKGGTFAIHDLMSQSRYGDMQKFKQMLIDMGYESVELIDTTDGMFMTKREARCLRLGGSTLLVGKK